MRQHQETLEVRAPKPGLIDISREVAAFVERSGIRTGVLTLFIQHTSASLVIQENADPAVLRDLERWMSDVVPRARNWEHDEEGPDDMPAHCRAAILKTSETIPVANGRPVLGTWQGIYLFEHRDRHPPRKIVAHILGEG